MPGVDAHNTLFCIILTLIYRDTRMNAYGVTVLRANLRKFWCISVHVYESQHGGNIEERNTCKQW